MLDFVYVIHGLIVKLPYMGWLPVWVMQGIFMLVSASVVLGGISLFSGVFSVVERNFAGRIQSRHGANRVGPWGWFQFIADGIKLFLKEDLVPTAAAAVPFKIAPYFAFTVAYAVFVVLPFSSLLQVADLNIGIMYVTAVSSAAVIAILLAGWSSGNKWSLFGAMRAAAQIVSYEVPITVTILAVVVMAGTLSMKGIVEQQGGGFWMWFVFKYPVFTVPAFIIFYIASIAEVNRTPFDIPEAESELVAGFHTEYSSMRFAMFFMAENVNMLAVCAVATTLFLGGWQAPYPGSVVGSVFGLGTVFGFDLVNIEQLCWFVGKTLSLVMLMMLVRWTLPRYRVDQLMDLSWKVLLPISFLNLFGICTWMLLA